MALLSIDTLLDKRCFFLQTNQFCVLEHKQWLEREHRALRIPLQDEEEGEMLGQTKRLITWHPFSPRLGDLMNNYVTSDQIEQEFTSMSDLKNDVAKTRQQPPSVLGY